MRKWIAFILLAAFLPTAAMAQGCATRCALAPAMHQVTQAADVQNDSAQMSQDHCQKQKKAETCSFALMCDLANLYVLHAVAIQFAAAPPSDAPPAFLADFMSVTYPPALRPPTV
jgi:hypothetical protein